MFKGKMNEMHPALASIRAAIAGTPFEGDLFLVGGAVRDEMLGLPPKADFDLVTRGASGELAQLLFEKGISTIFPVTYERFGTAMVHVEDIDIEIVTARRESYDESSRKPHVEPASYEEDAHRRDFTVNTLMRNLQSGELRDPLGAGLTDLKAQILRTPLDPVVTFHDDPLRMMRAVRFRWQLGFQPAPGLYEAIGETRERLRIVSFERIRDELVKMLARPTGPDALDDLRKLGLTEIFAPEFDAMVGVEQGNFHHLDVWDHTLLVMRNTWRVSPEKPDLSLILGALFHDVGKPPTRMKDENDRTRFFGHEDVGGKMTREILRRWKFSEREIEPVVLLVRNHMRLGSAPVFTKPAARRLIRDLGRQVEPLLTLVEADASSLKPGVRALDLTPIRAQIEAVAQETPRETLESPLTGAEIMEILGIDPGQDVGKWKQFLTEKVLEGELKPGDKEAARAYLLPPSQ